MVDTDALTQQAIGHGRIRNTKQAQTRPLEPATRSPALEAAALKTRQVGSKKMFPAVEVTTYRGADGYTAAAQIQPASDASVEVGDYTTGNSLCGDGETKAAPTSQPGKPRFRKKAGLRLAPMGKGIRPALQVDTQAKAVRGAIRRNPFSTSESFRGGDSTARAFRRISTAAEVLLHTHSLATSVSTAMFLRVFAL